MDDRKDQTFSRAQTPVRSTPVRSDPANRSCRRGSYRPVVFPGRSKTGMFSVRALQGRIHGRSWKNIRTVRPASLKPGTTFWPYCFPAGGVYTGIGNCDTLEPSNALILLTPCLRTSSMRRIECIGR
jgi:hypothetical protein